MSLCDSDTKKQVEASTKYAAMLLDSMNLLRIITKLVYARGTNNLNVRHNKAMAHINLMTLSQEKIQDIQEFRDHYMAMRKVCHELCLKFRRWEDDARAVIKEKGVTKPTSSQLKRLLTRLKRCITWFYFYTRLIKQIMED